MSATIHPLRPTPEPINESEVLAKILEGFTPIESDIMATRKERRARYKRLHSDANARRARSAFHVV